MTLTQQFIDNAPSPLAAAYDFAKALMADGPDFRLGYTAENAYIATVEAFRRDGAEINEETLGALLGFDGVLTDHLLSLARTDAS